MSAKRLPNKPLLKINGKSIISLVYSKAVACKIGRVIVATTDKKISDEINKYKGNVEDTIQSILGGVRSTMTYIGAQRLKDLPKCTTFIRVNRQVNELFK